MRCENFAHSELFCTSMEPHRERFAELIASDSEAIQPSGAPPGICKSCIKVRPCTGFGAKKTRASVERQPTKGEFVYLITLTWWSQWLSVTLTGWGLHRERMSGGGDEIENQAPVFSRVIASDERERQHLSDRLDRVFRSI